MRKIARDRIKTIIKSETVLLSNIQTHNVRLIQNIARLKEDMIIAMNLHSVTEGLGVQTSSIRDVTFQTVCNIDYVCGQYQEQMQSYLHEMEILTKEKEEIQRVMLIYQALERVMPHHYAIVDSVLRNNIKVNVVSEEHGIGKRKMYDMISDLIGVIKRLFEYEAWLSFDLITLKVEDLSVYIEDELVTRIKRREK